MNGQHYWEIRADGRT